MVPLNEPRGRPAARPQDAGGAADDGDGPDIKRILKIFNYVNDDKQTKVNIKFLSLVAAFLVTAGLLVAYAAWGPYGTAGPDDTAAAQEQTDFVGLTPVEASLYGSDADLIEARLDSWLAEHPDAEIVSVERAYDDADLWIGYEITYRQ